MQAKIQWALLLLLIATNAGVVGWLAMRPSADTLPPQVADEVVGSEPEPSGDRGAAENTEPQASDANSQSLATESETPDLATVKLPPFRLPMNPAALEAEAKLVGEVILKDIPNDARATHVAAVAKSQLRETEAAEKLWQQCIELDPRGEPYYMNLAANALNRGDAQTALDTLEKARANQIESPDISHHLALALANLGRDEEALTELEQAIEKSESQPMHWLLLGQTQLKLGQSEEAIASLLQAQEKGINNKPLYTALMNAYLQSGQREAAKESMEALKKFEVEHPVEGSERYTAASEGEARRILISVLREAAAVYRHQGRLQDAEAHYLRLLALNPSDLVTCRELAEFYTSQSRWGDELEVRERIVELEPHNLMNYLMAGKVASQAKQFPLAESYIKRAISIAPLAAVSYAAMTEFLLERSRAEEALWYVTQAIMREDSPSGYRLLARVYRSLGREQEAQAAEDRVRGQL